MPLRFLNPNLHVILVHYPLGVFVLGVVLELLGFMWRRSTVRSAGRWMIALGALLTLPASTSGIAALADLQQQGIDDNVYQMFRLHVIFMGIASITAVVCAVIGLGASDKLRRILYIPLLVGVLAAWGLMVIGAWNGGEAIYQHGASVAIIKKEPINVPLTGTAKSATADSITLDSNASSTDGVYEGKVIKTTGGTGGADAGQVRKIVAYVGSTHVATVDNNWDTTPDATTTYVLPEGNRFLDPSGSAVEMPVLAMPPVVGHFRKLDNNVLTYQEGAKGTGMLHNVMVGEKTKVKLDGNKAALTDLVPDIYLQISFNPNAMATRISASSVVPKVDAVEFYGGGILQQHLIMAGFALAAAMGALGLALRRVSSTTIAKETVVEIKPVAPGRQGGADDMTMLHSFNPQSKVQAPTKSSIPSARFWLLATLITLATAGLGYWKFNQADDSKKGESSFWQITDSDAFKKDGWVNFIDKMKPEPDKLVIKRKEDGTMRTSSIGSAVTITLNGAPSNLAAIAAAPNAPVLVQYTDKTKTVVASVVVNPSATDGKEFQTEGTVDHVIKEPKINRHLAHAILGGSMVLLMLICAILAVAAPRRGWTLGIFALLLVAVVAAQVWIGILLTFNMDGKSLTKFDPKESTALIQVQPSAYAHS